MFHVEHLNSILYFTMDLAINIIAMFHVKHYNIDIEV